MKVVKKKATLSRECVLYSPKGITKLGVVDSPFESNLSAFYLKPLRSLLDNSEQTFPLTTYISRSSEIDMTHCAVKTINCHPTKMLLTTLNRANISQSSINQDSQDMKYQVSSILIGFNSIEILI